MLKSIKIYLIAAVTFASSIIVPLQPTSALSGSQWRAGNIIDDALFFKKNDMTVTEIQAFLNSMVPSCDTWGTKTSELGGGTRAQYGQAAGYPAPFVCLRDYVENPTTKENNLATAGSVVGGVGAAQIIKTAADTYNINPKVLLVTIQKESSMITDDWPLSVQYDAIMGFDCPDSGPNNSANCNSAYAGFYNQMNLAARQFNLYASNPQNYRYKAGQMNTIQFNPNVNCGSSSVYIENQATAGLYNYTPYQPNTAALNNLYGYGNDCSAYGNRNFWRLFNEWFGRTTFLFGTVEAKSTLYASLPCTVPQFTSAMVGRLYNPDTQNYIYTTSRTEACGAIKLGFIWDDVVFKNEPANGVGVIPVHRLRLSTAHVYTASEVERETLVDTGYTYEGVAFYAFSADQGGSLPVYQLGQFAGSEVNRFMTSAGDEGTYFVNDLGYASRGVGFYTAKITPQESNLLYRLRNGNDRFYTVYASEAATAKTSFGYLDEGNALNVEIGPGLYSKPVYRLNGPGGRLYTTSREERDRAVVDFKYKAEGVGFYSFSQNLANTTAIYRSTNYGQQTRLYTPYLGEHLDSRTLYGYKTEGISWYVKEQ